MTKRKAVKKVEVVAVEKKPPADHRAGVIPLLAHDPRNEPFLQARRYMREIKRFIDAQDMGMVTWYVNKLRAASHRARTVLEDFTPSVLSSEYFDSDSFLAIIQKLQNESRKDMVKNLKTFNPLAFKKPKVAKP